MNTIQGALGELAWWGGGPSDSGSCAEEVGGGPQLHSGVSHARGEVKQGEYECASVRG